MAATVVATLVTPWRIKRSSRGGRSQKPKKPQRRHQHGRNTEAFWQEQAEQERAERTGLRREEWSKEW